MVAACRGKISSLGDQLLAAVPLPAGLPLRPSVAAEEPRTRWCRIPASALHKHCIASQAVPKARCAAADLAHHCRRPLSSTARNHHMLRHHRCCCCYFQPDATYIIAAYVLRPFRIPTRYCSFVTAAPSWLAVLPLRVLVGSLAGLTWPLRASIQLVPESLTARCRSGSSLDWPMGSSTPSSPVRCRHWIPFTACTSFVFYFSLFARLS